MKMQYSANTAPTTSATSKEVLPERSGALKRTQLIVINTGAGAVTIMKGNSPVAVNKGIVLQTNAYYLEATDGGYTCWNGAVQAISAAAGTLSIVESFEEN